MRQPVEHVFQAMGTRCALQFHDCDPAAAAFWGELAEAEVERIEHKYSRYRDDSTLSSINRAAASAGKVDVDDETAALLDFAFACWRKSDGLFDMTSGVLRRAWSFSDDRLPGNAEIDALLPLIGLDKLEWNRPALRFTVPGMELDFGGIGKEYAVDRLADMLADAGMQHVLIDLGGDIRVLGPLPDGTPWRIGLRDPREPDAMIGSVSLMDGALATSGDYERFKIVDGRRYCHIFNPKTGWPVTRYASVTVLSSQCMVAGSLSSIAMLKGDVDENWLPRLGALHCWVDTQHRQGGTIQLVRER